MLVAAAVGGTGVGVGGTDVAAVVGEIGVEVGGTVVGDGKGAHAATSARSRTTAHIKCFMIDLHVKSPCLREA
jgi:hypothetical protein